MEKHLVLSRSYMVVGSHIKMKISQIICTCSL